MSYFTKITAGFAPARPDLDALIGRAREFFEAFPGHDPLLDQYIEDLRTIFESGDYHGRSFSQEEIEPFMEHVSAGFPGVKFFMRGVGEEFDDVWLRVFLDGRTTLSVGTFDMDLSRALRKARRS